MNNDLLESSGFSDIADCLTKNPVVKWVGGNIPVIGPPLMAFLEYVAGKRGEKLLRKLEADLEKVNKEKISNDFLESDEFGVVLLRALRLSKESLNEEKIVLFARILAGAIKRSQINELEDAAEFLDIVDALRIEDLPVLSEIMHAYEEGKASGKHGDLQIMQEVNLLDRLTDVSREQLEVSELRLTSLALIRKITNETDSEGDVLIASGDVYAPTIYAQQFVTYVKDAAVHPSRN